MSLILVVEDEHNLRIALERILKDAGYEVVQGESGKEALRLCQKTPFDLVITDLAMPDMDGLELIQSLRRFHLDLPILAISGAFNGEFLRIAKALGAVGTLDKPFTKGDLLAVMNKSLGKRSNPQS